MTNFTPSFGILDSLFSKVSLIGNTDTLFSLTGEEILRSEESSETIEFLFLISSGLSSFELIVQYVVRISFK